MYTKALFGCREGEGKKRQEKIFFFSYFFFIDLTLTPFSIYVLISIIFSLLFLFSLINYQMRNNWRSQYVICYLSIDNIC